MRTEDTFWGRAPSPSWLMGMGNGGSRGGMHSFGAWLMGMGSEGEGRDGKVKKGLTLVGY